MLKLGHRELVDGLPLVMAIVSRTPDSFYDGGATYAEDAPYGVRYRVMRWQS